jgi:hypothetical protein
MFILPVDILSLAILVIVAISGASIVLYTLENGIASSPTGGRVKRHLLNILADLPSGPRVYELGSGWGTLALPIAAQFENSRVTGYENSIVPYLASRIRLALSSARNLELVWANFFKIDLSDATLIVCYQSPGTMSNLRPKFEAELSDDTYVVSNTFAIPGWKPPRHTASMTCSRPASTSTESATPDPFAQLHKLRYSGLLPARNPLD